MSTLRLFLLNTVLFPGMELPLHVFEERYKQLVAECLTSGDAFGVALIRDGQEVGDRTADPHLVGCTARIEQAAPTEGGRIMVEARGEQRFRILDLDDGHPYRSATVEYPVDELTEVPASLLARAAEGYRQIVRLRALGEGTYEREIPVPPAPGELADRIATAASGMVEPARMQTVLEAFDVHRRLEAVLEFLGPVVEAHHAEARVAVARRFPFERMN